MRIIHLAKISKGEKIRLLEIAVIFIIVVSIGYNGREFLALYNENILLNNQVIDLENKLEFSEKKLSLAKTENASIHKALQGEKETNNSFQNQIKSISGTVGILQKLSQTDSELLKKYSKVYFLNENYVPPKLTEIPEKYLNPKDRLMQIHTDIWPHLQSLLDSALSGNVVIQVTSAYRSFGTQAILKSSYKFTYGAGTANSFSAEQGYSEHQLGTTVDFTTPSVGSSFSGFDKTDAYAWLLANAHKYGFILSYPKENTYYVFEPWHFRYVGVALATRLHDQNTYFYALDQHDIDQYLVNFFD